MKLEIYDPPMCCSTGVCGPRVDPALVQFAADLEWLQRKGVEVLRYNLSQQPAAFVGAPVVKAALTAIGNDCLPLTLVDGKVACMGSYLSRDLLARVAGVEADASLFTDAVRELVAIGAAIASNCEPCFKHHYLTARKLGVSKADMTLAVELAHAVKETPAKSVLVLAAKLLHESEEPAEPCCGSTTSTPSTGTCCR